MRPLRALTAVAVVLLATAGCTGGSDDEAGRRGTDPSAAGSPAPVQLAGPAEAEALEALPAGPATGTAVLAFSGLGELRAPFTGECSHDGDATRIEGSADTARITLVVGPDGARIELDDAGVTATSQLGTGRYEVSNGHLSLAADLAQDDQRAGSAELEIDCGG